MDFSIALSIIGIFLRVVFGCPFFPFFVFPAQLADSRVLFAIGGALTESRHVRTALIFEVFTAEQHRRPYVPSLQALKSIYVDSYKPDNDGYHR